MIFFPRIRTMRKLERAEMYLRSRRWALAAILQRDVDIESYDLTDQIVAIDRAIRILNDAWINVEMKISRMEAHS